MKSDPGLRAEKRAMKNDPIERLNDTGRGKIRNAAALFEGQVGAGDMPSEGDRLALHRAMARFLIDSGVASARNYV